MGEIVIVRARMRGKVDSEEVESTWLNSHKRARVHNNFKIEDLIME